jgi:membrane fusion protein, copper/silver efflux system
MKMNKNNLTAKSPLIPLFQWGGIYSPLCKRRSDPQRRPVSGRHRGDFVNRFLITASYLLIALITLAGCSREQSQPAHEQHKVGEQQKAEVQKEETPGMPKSSEVKGYSEIQLEPERLQKTGISVSNVSLRRFTKTLRTVGIVEMDETRVAHVHTKFSGWIEDLYVDFIGKTVKRGQPLFSVYSPEILTTQEEFLLALRDTERIIKGPFASEASRAAKELLVAARRRLELLDVPPEEIAFLEKTRTPKQTVTINSPRYGVVIQKNAQRGMGVNPDMDLYVIADLSNIWVKADIYEYDIPFVRLGQKSTLSFDALPGKTLKGTVKFISPILDETTRTIKVRFEFDNRNQLLKPGMYATVELAIDMGYGLAVPEEAVIDTGERKIVFVAKGEGRFEAREVELRNKVDNFYPVLSGLSKDELVATSAQFLLDSESRLKATTGDAMPGMEMGKGKK